MIDDLGPLLETGSRVGIVTVTVIISIRLLNATFTNSRTSWEQAIETLTASATYAKADTASLRKRVTVLEDERRQFAETRAAWLIERAELVTRIGSLETERAELVTRIGSLETTVQRLTEELGTITGDHGHPSP